MVNFEERPPDQPEKKPPEFTRDLMVRYLLSRLSIHASSFTGVIDTGRVEELTYLIQVLLQGGPPGILEN